MAALTSPGFVDAGDARDGGECIDDEDGFRIKDATKSEAEIALPLPVGAALDISVPACIFCDKADVGRGEFPDG